MNRKQRTRLFIDFGRREAIAIAQEIESRYLIEMISAPSEALTMIKVRETAENSLFYLGEVLVTETKARLNDHLGLGIVIGSDQELSYALALIDSAYKADVNEISQWNLILKELEEKANHAIQKDHDLIALTKVDFETMKE